MQPAPSPRELPDPCEAGLESHLLLLRRNRHKMGYEHLPSMQRHYLLDQRWKQRVVGSLHEPALRLVPVTTGVHIGGPDVLNTAFNESSQNARTSVLKQDAWCFVQASK